MRRSILRTSLRNSWRASVARLALLVLLVPGLLATTGCNTFGPRAVSSSQGAYNQVLGHNFKQQLLLNLVRLRYRDVPYFLDVQTLTVSYDVRANASIGGVFGEGGEVAGSNGAGIGVNEGPTVSYAPLQGAAYVKQLLAAIPLETVMLLPQAGWSIERVFRIAVQGLEQGDRTRLPNAPSASGPTPDYVPRYREFLSVSRELRELQRTGSVVVHPCGLAPGSDPAALSTVDPANPATPTAPVAAKSTATDPETVTGCYELDVTPADAATSGPEAAAATHRSIATLRQLLELPEAEDGAPLRLEFAAQDDRAGDEDLVLSTRSLLGILYFLSQGVEAPAEHEERGFVTVTRYPNGERFDWNEVVGDLFTIRSGRHEPAGDDAFVSVRYLDHWFWIPNDDLQSKTTFGLLSQLVSLQSGDERVTPVLAFSTD